ncbi:hypothetical protein HNQ94_000119 [Salirhabdus euzebyi]|uniref:Uncharacterized protein n=1 Tax=Salirhabdus euzebyi TaxID=394506 RepID=A0A841Q2W2_9BACI|nr:hypothetical protein [Salirhabdus euzebyi]MBB6451698.1 hypothetical protein [Salirhabdus euzebyi]
MKRLVSLLIGLVVLVVMSTGVGAEGKSELAEARKGTAKYHNVQKAIDDGYLPTDEFVSVPGLGVMGYHYVNPGLVDGEVDASSPEVLLYVPMKNGDVQLVGVEYLSTSEDSSLFGQQFDPPGAVEEYSLHVWIWKHNPNGMFAHFNPSIKVY